MCTLTFIPRERGGYTLTHNRDERADRPASSGFESREIKNQRLFFPQDLEALGTWMAFSGGGTTACILNGGTKAYLRRKAYRKSRGLVVLESFHYESAKHFCSDYDFQDIEPFTLIIAGKNTLHEVIHDEDKTRLSSLPVSEKYIWSSTTLYSSTVRRKREKWFQNWLQAAPLLTPENILAFHQSAGEGDPENNLMMSRWGLVQTVSITQVSVQPPQAFLRYKNFATATEDSLSVNL